MDMKPFAILALAVALEAGFLLTAALPAPVLARAEAAVKDTVIALARTVTPGAPLARKSWSHSGSGSFTGAVPTALLAS
jgi:hypothetical protein